MKVQKFIFAFVIACFTLISCQKEIKKENVSLAISGMTCEIGCAKTIQSKLTKKEGVLAAKVVFSDSIATIEFDTNTLSKKDLIAFVDGIAGGDLYTASEISNQKHACSDSCKSKCEMMETKKTCKEDCKMECCKDKKA
ncbi:cation transporter [Polaribacter sp.]|nr:cation transporter [Polaribacter sp.]